MKNYVILVESGGDVPASLVEKYGIYVVPMHVTFGDDTRDDGTFPITELFGYYKKTKTLPKTAGCNAHDFEIILNLIHEEHPDKHILYLAYSSVTTVSYSSCLIAMEGRDYITAFDTKHCSAGQAFVVNLVCRYIEEHQDASIEEIIAKAEEWRVKTHMGFFPGDLDYLRAGGRVSNAAYMGAKILSLNPLIEINNGYLEATKKYRGKMSKVSSKLLKEFAAQYHFDRKLLFFVYSYGFSDIMKEELTAQAKKMGFEEIMWVQTGSVVSTHSGPGAFGVIGLEA